jgi:hypothetical protein
MKKQRCYILKEVCPKGKDLWTVEEVNAEIKENAENSFCPQGSGGIATLSTTHA